MTRQYLDWDSADLQMHYLSTVLSVKGNLDYKEAHWLLLNVFGIYSLGKRRKILSIWGETHQVARIGDGYVSDENI